MTIKPAALRSKRQEAGHTGGSLGRKARVSKQRISELESAEVGIRETTAKRLADALECRIDDIATGVAAKAAS